MATAPWLVGEVLIGSLLEGTCSTGSSLDLLSVLL
jgi:hypothetical protein